MYICLHICLDNVRWVISLLYFLRTCLPTHFLLANAWPWFLSFATMSVFCCCFLLLCSHIIFILSVLCALTLIFFFVLFALFLRSCLCTKYLQRAQNYRNVKWNASLLLAGDCNKNNNARIKSHEIS